MFRNDSRRISAVYTALFASGFLYNVLTAWLERRSSDQGNTAISSVRSTSIALVEDAIAGWQTVMSTLGASACSEIWVIAGSWWRRVQAQQAGQEAPREDLP